MTRPEYARTGTGPLEERGNPFRKRHSDSPTDQGRFARTFVPEMLAVLPTPPRPELLVIRSAPGAGKTSLMRAMTADTLMWVHQRRSTHDVLVQGLEQAGVLDEAGPTVLGLKVNLTPDFHSLADVAPEAEVHLKLLLRLLDARIMREYLNSVALLGGMDSLRTASITITPASDGSGDYALDKLGGPDGASLLARSRAAEQEILGLLDQLVLRSDTLPGGHNHLHALRALNGATVQVNGLTLTQPVLVMLDDGHILEPSQRERLLTELSDRRLTLARWFAVRSKAFSDVDLLGAGDQGRDFEVVEIEGFSRERTSAGRETSVVAEQKMTPRRFRLLLRTIADRRADLAIERLGDGRDRFSDYLPVEPHAALANQDHEVLPAARELIAAAAGDNQRYRTWVQECQRATGPDGLAHIFEIGILIARDKKRNQGELFADPRGVDDDPSAPRGSSGLRDAGMLAASQMFRLPYYFGAETISRLASSNIEQFLDVCGDLLAVLQTQAQANRPIGLTAAAQDKVVRAASEKYYNAIPILPDGPLIRTLVDNIHRLAQKEATKPTVPYPPGVTGTALTMQDRARLTDQKVRKGIPGANWLARALQSAIAHNVVWVEPNYKVKGDTWMVIYLNRLLCPRFAMPLNLGSFRELPLRSMAAWFTNPQEQETLL